jgi:hypothetical protein
MDLSQFFQQIQQSFGAVNSNTPQTPQAAPPPAVSVPSNPAASAGLGGMSQAAPQQQISPQGAGLAQMGANPSSTMQGPGNPVVNPTGNPTGDAARTMTNTQVQQMQNVPGYGQVQGGYDPQAGSVNMKGQAGPQVSPLARMHNFDPPGNFDPLGSTAGSSGGGGQIKTDANGMPLGPPPQVTPQQVAGIINKLAPQLSQKEAMKYYASTFEIMQKQYDESYARQVEVATKNAQITLAAKAGDLAALKQAQDAKRADFVAGIRKEAEENKKKYYSGKEKLEERKVEDKELETEHKAGVSRNTPQNEDATPEEGGSGKTKNDPITGITEEESHKLPKGTFYINPTDGRVWQSAGGSGG